jgi:hypothetical protein
MADSSDILLNAGLFGVALPAALAGAGAALGRPFPRAAGPVAALLTAAGYVIAHTRIVGSVVWPAVDATQWLPLAALAGALVGALTAVASDALRLGTAAALALRSAGVAAIAVWIARGLLTGPIEAGGASIWLASALVTTGLYVGLDLLVRSEDRLRGVAGFVAAGVIAGAIAAVIALARSAVLGQMVGAAAAAIGGLAIAVIARVPAPVIRAALAPIAVVAGTGLAAALHYAELPSFAFYGFGAAALIVVGVASAIASERIHAATLVGGAAALMATVGFFTARKLEASSSTYTPAAEGDVELDYGYGPSSGDTSTAADTPSGVGAAPDPYLDPKLMENWQPPPAPPDSPAP